MSTSDRIVCIDCGEDKARNLVGVSVCKRCWAVRTGKAEALKEQRHYDRNETRYPDVAKNAELLKSLHAIASSEKSRGRWWWR